VRTEYAESGLAVTRTTVSTSPMIEPLIAMAAWDAAFAEAR
jgi:hypothetical protein